MKESTVEITILNNEDIIKYIPLIRKLTKKPINEIKKELLNKDPVIICQYTKEPEEFRMVYQTLKSLIDKGAQIKIVQNILDEMRREIDLEIVGNLIQRRREIEKQTEKIVDLEVGEE